MPIAGPDAIGAVEASTPITIPTARHTRHASGGVSKAEEDERQTDVGMKLTACVPTAGKDARIELTGVPCPIDGGP